MRKHEHPGDVVLQSQVDALVVYVHGLDDQIIGALDVIVDAIAVRIAVDGMCQNAKRVTSMETTTHCHVQLALKIDRHCPSPTLYSSIRHWPGIR